MTTIVGHLLTVAILLAFVTSCALAAMTPRHCTLCLQHVPRRHTVRHYIEVHQHQGKAGRS